MPEPRHTRAARRQSDLSTAVAALFFAGGLFAILNATVLQPERGWIWPNPTAVAIGTVLVGVLALLVGRGLSRIVAGGVTGAYMVFLIVASVAVGSLDRALVAGVLIVGANLIFAWFMPLWVGRTVGSTALIVYSAVLAIRYPGDTAWLGIVALCALSFLLTEVFGGFKRALHRSSLTDHLCQVWNRAGFERLLEKEIRIRARTRAPLSLLYLDLDGFKEINDAEGHLAGDRVLQEVARALEASVRGRDTVARIGGDEFVLILPRTSGDEARELALRLREQVTACAWSFGAAEYRDGETAQEFIERSDDELLRRKRRRRGSRPHRDVGPER